MSTQTTLSAATAELETDDEHACPWDGCERSFDTDMGVKVHHARAHGESIAGVKVDCAECGQTFREYPSRVERYDHDFCSKVCSEAFQEQKVEVDCAECGQTTRKKPSKAERNDHNFCSGTCSEAFHTGENNPQWNGGPAKYGPGWNERKRESVRERDDRECHVCGMSEAEHLTAHGCKLHVHHVRPAREFDDPEKRNAMGNLTSVCHSCHREWEGLGIIPDRR